MKIGTKIKSIFKITDQGSQIIDHRSRIANGFTLIELIVVIFIMAILSTIMLANFRAGQRQRSVQLAAETLVNAFRTAQSYALSGKEIPNSTCIISGKANKSPANYFVTMTYTTQYTLSATDNCNNIYIIQTYTFPANVRFRAGQLKVYDKAGSTSAKIYFTPPFGKVTGKVDSGIVTTFTQSTFIIESSDGSISRTVTVDGLSGKIE